MCGFRSRGHLKRPRSQAPRFVKVSWSLPIDLVHHGRNAGVCQERSIKAASPRLAQAHVRVGPEVSIPTACTGDHNHGFNPVKRKCDSKQTAFR